MAAALKLLKAQAGLAHTKPWPAEATLQLLTKTLLGWSFIQCLRSSSS